MLQRTSGYEEVIKALVSLQLCPFTASDFIVITSCSRKSATHRWANIALHSRALRSGSELCSLTGLLHQKHLSLLHHLIFGVGLSGLISDTLTTALRVPSSLPKAVVVLKERAKEERKHCSGLYEFSSS